MDEIGTCTGENNATTFEPWFNLTEFYETYNTKSID